MKRYLLLFIVFPMVLNLVACASKQAEVLQQKKRAEAMRNLGEAYIQEGNFSAALKELVNAEQLTPDDPYLQNDLGRAYMGKQHLNKAVFHFEKAISLKPDFAPAMNNLGAAYLAAEKWDKAIETLQILSENLFYGTPHFALSNMGYAYYNKKMYGQAEQKYLEALAIEPQFLIALRGLGNTYMAQGNMDKAISSFKKAVAAAPQYPELHADLAKAYIASRQFEDALGEMKKTLELAPRGSQLFDEATDIVVKLKRKVSAK